MQKKIKILLTGSSGQLGACIFEHLAKFKRKNKILIFKNRINFLKINRISLELNKIKPNIIINCAAYTDVERAEREKRLCNKINNLAVVKIANFCKVNNVYLIHFSTDFVFNGTSKIIGKFTKPDPLNYYGLTKYKAEQNIFKSKCKHLILRISWIYSKYKNNFPSKIIKQIKSLKNISIFGKEIGSPTSVRVVSEFVLKIIDNYIKHNEITGVYNLACRNCASRYIVAKFILNYFKILNRKYSKIKIYNFQNKENSKIKRPKISIFCLKKIKKKFYKKIPNWRIEMKDFLKNNYNNL